VRQVVGKALKLIGLPVLLWGLTTAAILGVSYFAIDRKALFNAVLTASKTHLDLLVTVGLLVMGWLGLAVTRSIMLAFEVQKSKRAEDAALHLARYDPLTGLLNRRAFFEEAETFLKRKSSGPASQRGILFIDLDGFKTANDIHGHAAGDAILIEVAGRLSRIADKSLVARVGGDEFVMLVHSVTDPKKLVQLGHQVSRTIERPIKFGRVSLVTRASIGISVSKAGEHDVESLLRTADIAMYQVKKQGGRQFQFFEEWMDAELQQQAALREELRSAIAADRIVPFLQPFVDLSSGEVAGFEALARWKHPTKGIITPDRFIALAEEDGLIGELFFSILRQACKEGLKWTRPAIIAVNVSPVQLVDSSFAEGVLRLLARMKFDPRRLEIEITESALVQDSGLANRTLTKLRDAGVRISLDDFGTGFSSLYQLKEMPFDKVKLDRSFVGNSASDPKNQRYVSAMVSFGRALGLHITAEGVEDIETANLLADLGCTYAQGYLFSRPVAPEMARELLKAPLKPKQPEPPADPQLLKVA